MDNTLTGSPERILESAARLFSARGYHRVSVDLIARESGVAKGTIYYHFKGKEDLYFAILIRGMDRMIAELEAIVATDGTAQERLRRLVKRIFDFFIANRSFFQMLITQERLMSGELFRRCKDKRDAAHRLIEQVIARGIAEGGFRNVSPYDAATVLQGMIRAMVLDWAERGVDPVNHDLVLAVFLRGVTSGDKEMGRP